MGGWTLTYCGHTRRPCRLLLEWFIWVFSIKGCVLTIKNRFYFFRIAKNYVQFLFLMVLEQLRSILKFDSYNITSMSSFKIFLKVFHKE